MRVAYVGDILNHGYTLTTVGTSIVFLLSRLQVVDSIDIICPVKNNQTLQDFLPRNVEITRTYVYGDLLSFFKILLYDLNKYDRIIFNILPTGAGKSTTANFLLLLLPILVKILLDNGKVVIVYHNSTYINDTKALGYIGLYNTLRGYILRMVETVYFRHIDTFFLLRSYKNIIDKIIPNNRVRAINAQYLEAFATVMLNELENFDIISKSSKKLNTILLHGFWGPQKDLDGALSVLSALMDKGLNCRIIVSGGLNKHFKEYESYFTSIIYKYRDYIEIYKGYVEESEMANLLIETDLIILPYNTPGGHSGVLEQAKFFEVPAIAMDFLEYREQSENAKDVYLVSNMNEMADTVLKVFGTIDDSIVRNIDIKNKLTASIQNISRLLL